MFGLVKKALYFINIYSFVSILLHWLSLIRTPKQWLLVG